MPERFEGEEWTFIIHRDVCDALERTCLTRHESVIVPQPNNVVVSGKMVSNPSAEIKKSLRFGRERATGDADHEEGVSTTTMRSRRARLCYAMICPALIKDKVNEITA